MSKLLFLFKPDELNVSWKLRKNPIEFKNFKEDKISTVEHLEFKEKNRNRIYVSPFEMDDSRLKNTSISKKRIDDEEKALQIEREIWTLLKSFVKAKDKSYPAKDAIKNKINDLNMYEFTPRVLEEFEKIHKAVHNYFFSSLSKGKSSINKTTSNTHKKSKKSKTQAQQSNKKNVKTNKPTKNEVQPSKNTVEDIKFYNNIIENITSIKNRIYTSSITELSSLKDQLKKLGKSLNNRNNKHNEATCKSLQNRINQHRQNIDRLIVQKKNENTVKNDKKQEQIYHSNSTNKQDFDLAKYMEERANKFRDNSIGNMIQIKSKKK